MIIMLYDIESQSRNADFILIAREGDTTTLGAKGPVKLKNPWAEGPSILRTLFIQPFYTTCLRQQATTCGEAAPLFILRRSRHHNPQRPKDAVKPKEALINSQSLLL